MATSLTGKLWLVAKAVRANSRSDPAGAVVHLAIAAVLTLIALVVIAAPTVGARRAERQASLAPVTQLSPAAPSPGSLLVLEPRATSAARWNGHLIARDYYAEGSSSAPRIPGTTRAPRDGEYFASPALVRLMNADEAVAALFSAQRRVGILGAEGLTDPHDLRAVIGIPRSGPLLSPVERFGIRSGRGHDDDRVLNASVLGLSLALLCLPAGALLAIGARLHTSTRRGRYQSLRNLGLSRRSTGLVHAVESAASALPGAVLGAGGYVLASRHLTRMPGSSVGFFAEDTQLDLCVVISTAAIVFLILVGTSARFRSERREQQERVPGTLGTLGLGAAAASVVALLAMPLLQRALGPGAVFGMWIACVVSAAGLAVAAPTIVERLCRPLSEQLPSAAALVGLRLSYSVATSTARLGGLACVVIVLGLGCSSFTAILNGGSYSHWTSVLARQTKVPIVVSDLTGRLRLDEIRRLGMSDGLAQVRQTTVDGTGPPTDEGRAVQVVYASCEDLGKLTGTAPVNCSSAALQWINRPGPVRASSALHIGEDHVPLPEPSAVVSSRGLPSELDGAIKASPDLAPPAAAPGSGFFLVLAEPQHLTTTMASLSSLVPALQLDLGDLGRSNPDSRQFPAQVEWLTVACRAALAVTALALLCTILGEARERSRRLRGLRVLGASRSTLVRVHLWSVVLPLTVLGGISSLVGTVVSLSLHSFDDRASVPVTGAIACMAGSSLVALILGLSTVRAVLRPTERSAGFRG